jgi:asparagine synthase (glutamine-hydrolysing)
MEIRSAGKGVIALTARVADADADESDDAAVTARQLGLEHVLVEMPRDQFIRDLEACVAMRGVPLGMHNEVAMHLLARAASRRSKVLFCGEGADELFGGYGRIFRLPFDHARARIADSLAEPVGRWIRDRLDLVESAAGRDERAFFSTRYTYFPRSDKLRLLTTEMQRKVSHDEALDGVLDEAFTYGRQRSLLDAISLVFLEVHLPGLLAMVDGATMASGVEGRVPFLDDRVVQAAFALPAGDKVAWRGPWSAVRAATEPIAQFSERRDQTKAILRRAYRTHVSAGVQARRKKGFPIPLEAWLGGSMGAHVEATLCGRSARLGDIVNLRRLSTWIRAGAAAPSAARAQQLMRFYTLELFLRKWC